MVAGFVQNIRETNKYCKFSVKNNDYVYFKNKSNTFDDNIKVKDKSRIMKLLFSGSYVELNATPKNVIEDIYIDYNLSNAMLWYEDFKEYVLKNFNNSSHVYIEAMFNNIPIDNIDNFFKPLIKKSNVLKDPFNKSLKTDILNLLEFYDKYYDQSAICRNLKNDIKNEITNQNIITINKHIRKISSKVDYETFKSNPFTVLDGTTSMLFNTLSIFAKKYELDHDLNLEGTIDNCIYEFMKKGHICFPLELLCKHVFKLMAQIFDFVSMEDIVEKIKSCKKYTIYEDKVLFTFVFRKESYVADKIQEYIEDYYDESNRLSIDVFDEIYSLINIYELENNLKLNQKQKEAIKQVFNSNTGISMMTGLPGSGKTSVVKCIIHIAKSFGLAHALTAPTGKSANKLGCDAFTIHRLLEPIPTKDDGVFKFNKNESNPLLQDIIVIDEISMLDIEMFYHFMKACKKSMRILLIGDNNQLPSVNYGDVLNSLIKSNMIPHVHLSKVYRQGKESTIPSLAKLIVDRKIPNNKDLNNTNVTTMFMDNETQIKNYVLEYYKNECDKNSDNIILIPTKKCTTGTIKMNENIHNHKYGNDSSKKYVEGEKIICTSNTYIRDRNGEVNLDKSVFNGDSGYFIKYCPKMEIEMCTNEKNSVNVPYESIEYGYCISVHKSQGSEYDKVLLVLHHTHGIMLNNQVLYTAITRAKNHITIITTKESLEKCIMTNNTCRFDILHLLIKNGLEEV